MQHDNFKQPVVNGYLDFIVASNIRRNIVHVILNICKGKCSIYF